MGLVDDLLLPPFYTLEGAIAAAGDDPAKAEAVAHAEALLEQLQADLSCYGPEARGIMAYFEAEDYQNYRWQVAQAIIALKR